MKHIAIGPMSSEVIEAVYRYSHVAHKPFSLIASKNQIDYNGGYVNDWNTNQYMSYVKQMRQQYVDSDVLICRDHCGPAFNGKSDLTDVYKTIETDIRAGFDLIHIDFCHYKGPRQVMLDKAAEAIKYCKHLNSRIMFEIGTDEIGKIANVGEIQRDVEFFIKHCQPTYYVVNTGSLVKEDQQFGVFNHQVTERAWNVLRNYNIQLKEHNADYLVPKDIQQRQGVVDAMNIAPELGVKQTEKVLQLADRYGINTEPFITVSHKSKKWKKWLQFSTPDDVLTCATLAGHYNFTTPEYQRIIKHLSDHVDIKEELINTAIGVLDRYVTNF